MGRFGMWWRWFALPAVVGIVLAVGCAGDSDSGPDPTPTPVPKRPVLIAWGSSGMLWAGSATTSCASEVLLIKNFIKGLAQKETGIRILYATDGACDPRTDAKLCSLVTEWARLAPFFNMVNEVGTIEFKALATVDPFNYDVVILDCCRTSLTTNKTVLERFINTATRGGVLVFGSNSCYRSGTPSSQLANSLTGQYGITFTTEDPSDRNCFAIPETLRVGLMSNVSSVSIFRAAPMTVTAPAQTIFANAAGQSLAAVYERVNP